jgi:hypothetical protein
MLVGLALSTVLLAHTLTGTCEQYDPSPGEVQTVMEFASQLHDGIPTIELTCMGGFINLSPVQSDYNSQYNLRWPAHETYEDVAIHWGVRCSSTLWRRLSCEPSFTEAIVDSEHIVRVNREMPARTVSEVFSFASGLGTPDEVVSEIDFVRGDPSDPWSVHGKGYIVVYRNSSGLCPRHLQVKFDCHSWHRCVWWLVWEGRVCH